MKVILLLCVLEITCVSYGQEVKRVASEEITKIEEKEDSEDKKIGEENLTKTQLGGEDFDLGKLNNNKTQTIKLDNDFTVQEGTQLGRIVVPDLPEEAVKLQYQSQNIFETKDNVTLAELIIVNETSITTEDKISPSVANLEHETETNTFQPESKEKYDKYLNGDLKDIFETTTELPTTANPKRTPSNEVNQAFEVSHTTVTRKNCTSSNIFPRLDFETVKRVFTKDQDNKVKRSSVYEPRLKKFERKSLDSWNFHNFEEEKHGSIVKITKEVPYPVPYPVEKKVPFPVKVKFDRPIPIEVPKPYPVTFEKTVFFPIREYIHTHYPVFRKIPYFIQVSVDKPLPFHISKPYPVYIEKKVPYPMEKQIPIPINIPVDRPTPVHLPFVKNVYYPIEKKVHYPVPISVEKPIAVLVEKPYPVYVVKKVPNPIQEHFPNPIHVEENKIKGDLSHNYNFQKEDVGDFPDHKTEHSRISEFGVTYGNLESLSHSTNGNDHTLFQKKKDNESQESNKEEILQESLTTQLPLEQETAKEEEKTTKTFQDFGKKIKTL